MPFVFSFRRLVAHLSPRLAGRDRGTLDAAAAGD